MHDHAVIKYYLSGYLNLYFDYKQFSFKDFRGDYRDIKFQLMLNYLGISKSLKWPVCGYGMLSVLELSAASIIVTCKFLVSTLAKSIHVRKVFTGYFFTPGLEISASRFNKLYGGVINDEVVTIKIPYRSNHYQTKKISLYNGVTIRDVVIAYWYSLITIWYMYSNYRRRDVLYRNYSSFEYYLTCFFVKRNPNNTYIFHNLLDRWAMFFSNIERSILIQHGKLEEWLKFIKINAPKKVYYLNKQQKVILDKILFKTSPNEYGFRPQLIFTHNEKLIQNQKRNILVVSGLDFLDEEIPIIEMIKYKPINIYMKPHPKDKSLVRYQELSKNWGLILLEKEDFPKVDLVISYNSTLAEEYEDVGVKVIRYDLLEDINAIKEMIP